MKETVLHAIFLDLKKAYNALDRSKFLEILEGYDVGTRDIRLLHRYWERLQMVARAGGYYGEPFYGERGVTQGDPLLSKISNVVVDAVVHHWESLAAEWEDRGAAETTTRRSRRGRLSGKSTTANGRRRRGIRS